MTDRRKWQLVALAITAFLVAIFSVPIAGFLILLAEQLLRKYCGIS